MIYLDQVSKVFGKDFYAVKDMSFRIGPGEIVGFVGENGAGKTTTIKMMTGILKPTCGHIEIKGLDMQIEPLRAKQQIGYISDNPDLFLRLTGMEYLLLMADLYEVDTDQREATIEELAQSFEMTEHLYTPMNDYSHGMRQKIMIIGTLLHKPPVWILDEPMTGLDPKASYELKRRMKEHAKNGNAVFFSTHVLTVAEQLCSRILMVKKGQLSYDGDLESLKQKYPDKDLEEIFLLVSSN